MDFKPESPAVTSPDRTLQTTTGKRTDHHHTPTTSSSFSGGDGGGCIHSPATSSEEEEDMANCLIMLAHSVSPLKQEDESDHDTYYQKTKTLKIRSVTEMAVTTVTTTATGGGNSGHQSAYECKTCNRGFPSFQALGGHRASHKKPKLTVVSPPPEYSKHDQPQVVSINITTTNKSSSPATTHEKNNKLPKVHECSICGSEFLSGQALGGHMRRHRQAPPAKAKASPEVATAHVHHMMQKSPVMCVDLNLPPPEVVDDGHSSFQLTSGSSSQQHIVFSAAALVDCHY